MRRAVGRRAVLAAAGVAALAAAGAAGSRWLPGQRAAPPAERAAADTAEVVRADLARREQVPGTMGYAGDWPIAYPGPAGVLTWAPPPATVVQRGQRLLEVGGVPVYLLYGQRPPW